MAMVTANPLLDRTLARLWQHLAGLVAAMMGHVKDAQTGDPASTLPRWLRPSLVAAEALARRLLMIEARQLDIAGWTPRPGGPVPPTRATKANETTARPRGFALFEPVASLSSCIRIEGAPKRRFGPVRAPRIIDIFGEKPPVAEAGQTPRTPVWQARLAALGHLLETKDTAARRLARRLAARPSGTPARRRSPLRPGSPPGARSRQIPDWLREGLQMSAFELRGWPPPRPHLIAPAS